MRGKSKWKIHLLFGGAVPAAIAFNIVVNMFAGKDFSEAAWSAVRDNRPMEVLMLAAFWYGLAFYQPKDEWSSPFISLNLGSKDEGHS